MAETNLLPSAESDRIKILAYLQETAGTDIAERYNNDFRMLFRMLADHPESGPRRPFLGRDIRISVVSPYLVIYRYDSAADSVRILRLLDGRRKLGRQLLTGMNEES